MAVNDVIQVRIRSQRGVQLGQNIRHYLITSETTGGATLSEIAVALNDLLRPLYLELLSSDALFVGIAAQKVRPLPIGVEVDPPQTQAIGLRSGDPLPGQVCGLMKLTTATAGRRGRGRVYVPFPAETSNESDATPNATYTAALSALGAELVDIQVIVGASGSTTLQPVVMNRSTGAVISLNGFVVRNAWATQRRRGTFGATNPTPA